MPERVRVDPIPSAFASALRIEIGPPPRRDESTTDAVAARWSRLWHANPAYFDGPILSVTEARPADGLLRCARDSYRWLAVRPHVDTGAVLLAVTAILVAKNHAGREHVLLGRRGERTAVYPGLWEFGPAGGIEPPRDGRTSLGHADLVAQLRAEIEEETGLRPEVSAAASVALVFDRTASSLDIAMLAALSEPLESLPPPAPTWEFPQATWVPLDALATFLRQNVVIPPTRALAAFLGW